MENIEQKHEILANLHILYIYIILCYTYIYTYLCDCLFLLYTQMHITDTTIDNIDILAIAEKLIFKHTLIKD
jgi:hypothetical protein